MATWILEIIQLNKTIQANFNITTCLSLSPLPSSFLDLVKQRKLEQIRQELPSRCVAIVAIRDKVVFLSRIRAQERAVSETLNSLIENRSISWTSLSCLLWSFIFFLLRIWNPSKASFFKLTKMSGSDNTGNFLQVPGNETVGNDDNIPLVLVNNGAERKRSRAISKVSMSSDDGKQEESEKVS